MDSTRAVSKTQQTRYGHRGDAHIGEASHPGPKRISHTDAPDVDAVWACGVCTSWNHKDLKSCETCDSVKRPRRTKTGVSAAAQTRTVPTSAPAPVVTPVAPPANVQPSPTLPGMKTLVDSSPIGTGAAPAEMEEICLPAPAGTDAGFSVEETNESTRVSLLEDQEVARFHIERHKLPGDEFHGSAESLHH